MQIGQIADRFQNLEGHQDIGGPQLDQRGVDFFTVSKMGLHRPAALGHAVDLALLDVEAGGQLGMGGQLAGQQDALSAHTGKEYIAALFHHFASFLVIASNLQTDAHWPQPAH